MSKILMTATYTFKGKTYTNAQLYHLRAREAEEILAANKAKKIR